jgi:hypothetical protein
MKNVSRVKNMSNVKTEIIFHQHYSVKVTQYLKEPNDPEHVPMEMMRVLMFPANFCIWSELIQI